MCTAVLQHAGDIGEAVRQLDEAQSMDTADRYMNCWCARYMLKNHMHAEAEQMCAKFTRVRSLFIYLIHKSFAILNTILTFLAGGCIRER